MKKIATLACLLAAGMLAADTTPVMVSLVTPVQAPNRNYDVTGFRLSLIYGECQEFAGLDIGVIDNSRKDFTGLVLGGLNFVGERLYGAQVGLANWNGNGDTTWERRSVGAQHRIFCPGNLTELLLAGFNSRTAGQKIAPEHLHHGVDICLIDVLMRIIQLRFPDRFSAQDRRQFFRCSLI